MAALTAARPLYEPVGPTVILPIASAGNDTYYQGAMIVADASGYGNVPSDAAALIPFGVYTGRQGQEFAVANGAHDMIEVERGLQWIPLAGAAQTNVGEVFYLADDGTPTATIGTKTWGVLCVGFKAGYLLLDFDHPLKMA